MFTVQQIADIEGVTFQEAYGLVHFLAKKGVLVVTKERTGLAGKPRHMYSFADAPARSVDNALRPFYMAFLTKVNADLALATEAVVTAV